MRQKAYVFFIAIVLTCQIFGEIKSATEIRAPGNLLIPTASENKKYKCFISVTNTKILIDCKKKIIQPFNEFEVPKQSYLNIDTENIDRIWLDGYQIIILADYKFYLRYKNLFIDIRLISIYYSEKRPAIILLIDNPGDLGTAGKELINKIDERQKKRSTLKDYGYKGYVFFNRSIGLSFLRKFMNIIGNFC